MYCRQCGKKIEGKNVLKCPSCQARIGKGKRFCPECGKQNKHNKDFCDDCGFGFMEVSLNENRNKNPIVTPEIAHSEPINRDIYKQSQDAETESTGNSLADKIIKANGGHQNAFATYGKKPVVSPLTVPKSDEKPKYTDNFSIANSIPKSSPKEEKNDIDTQKNTHEEKNFTKSTNVVKNGIYGDDEDGENASRGSDKPNFSVFCLLYVIFAIASLCTCQLFYAIGMVIFSVIDFFKNKDTKGFAISFFTIAFMIASIYFGISFYMF